jgi:hypothetical protein
MSLRTVSTTVATVLLSFTPALAATGAHEAAHNYALWAFLSFCALIVVAQCAMLLRPDSRQSALLREPAAEQAKAH